MNSIVETGCEYYDLAILPAGSKPIFDDSVSMQYDWQLRDGKTMKIHSSMEHALRPMRIGAHLVLHINHWCDVLRVNQFALLSKSELVRYAWENGNIFSKIWIAVFYLFKLRSFRQHKILRRIGSIGKGCSIHPTAVIEACEIGNNVTIGPYAVVRASIIGDNAIIEEYATVNISVVGCNSKIGRYAMSNLSVIMSNAMVSHGFGYQSCVFGRNSFVAIGVALLDLSFGKTIRVEHKGKWVDSKQHFMGVCVGHNSKIGNKVRINYGVSIPNSSLLVATNEDLVRDASECKPDTPFRVSGKSVIPVVGRQNKSLKAE